MTIEESEELESVNAYDEDKASNDEVISFDRAVMEIEGQRTTSDSVFV